MRRLISTALALSVACSAAPAHAADEATPPAAPTKPPPPAEAAPRARTWTPDSIDRAVTGVDRWDERRLSLMGVVGIATPVGFAGGIAGYAVTRYLLLTGGVGLNPAGLQLAAMPRLRIAEPDAAFAMGVGPQGFAPCPAKGPKACPDYEGTTLPYFGGALGQAFLWVVGARQ